jgi:hypothetical protein
MILRPFIFFASTPTQSESHMLAGRRESLPPLLANGS